MNGKLSPVYLSWYHWYVIRLIQFANETAIRFTNHYDNHSLIIEQQQITKTAKYKDVWKT